MDGQVDGHAVDDAIIAVDHPPYGCLQAVFLPFGEEADVAQVDAQHRHVLFARHAGCAEESTVTAEDEHQLAVLRGVRPRVDGVQPRQGRVVIGERDIAVAEQPHRQTSFQQELSRAVRGRDIAFAAGVRNEKDNAVAVVGGACFLGAASVVNDFCGH